MAKKGSRQRVTRRGTGAARTVVDFAEDLGRLLGTAQAKASNWLNQRKDVIDELTQLRDTANQLLSDLTGGAAMRGGAQRGRRKAGNGATGTQATAAHASARGRRKMSAAARKAVSQRMRKYWAQRRKEKTAGS